MLVGALGISCLSTFEAKASTKKTVLYGNGLHDDTEALQALADNKVVYNTKGDIISNNLLVGGTYKVTSTIRFGDCSDDPLTIRNASFEAGRSWKNWFTKPKSMFSFENYKRPINVLSPTVFS